MARHVYKYRIKLKGSEKQELRQAKRKGRQRVRLVTRILIIRLYTDLIARCHANNLVSHM